MAKPNKMKNLTQVQATENISSKIESIEEMKVAEQSATSQHNHYTIIWVKKGCGTYTADMERVTIEDNTIYYIKPGQVISFNPRLSTDGYAISFSQEFFFSYEGQGGVLAGSELFNAFSKAIAIPVDAQVSIEMNSLAERMANEYGGMDLGKNEILRGLLKIFLLYMNRQFEQGNRQYNCKGSVGIAKKFFQLLEQNYTGWKMVADYARELSVTANYLNEIVKKVTGFPAKHHIQQRVILEAKRKAAYAEMSMKEVAYKLGFDDIYHFSKYFKNISGVNFTQFKKNITTQLAYA